MLVRVVARCCRLKADVVEADERETGCGPPELNRAVLNYGHTFAHALETTSGYGRWLHGEAVSIGMMCAARLARRLGRVDDRFVRRQRELLVALGLAGRNAGVRCGIVAGGDGARQEERARPAAIRACPSGWEESDWSAAFRPRTCAAP